MQSKSFLARMSVMREEIGPGGYVSRIPETEDEDTRLKAPIFDKSERELAETERKRNESPDAKRVREAVESVLSQKEKDVQAAFFSLRQVLKGGGKINGRDIDNAEKEVRKILEILKNIL